jgi:hypothetical protein
MSQPGALGWSHGSLERISDFRRFWVRLNSQSGPHFLKVCLIIWCQITDRSCDVRNMNGQGITGRGLDWTRDWWVIIFLEMLSSSVSPLLLPHLSSGLRPFGALATPLSLSDLTAALEPSPFPVWPPTFWQPLNLNYGGCHVGLSFYPFCSPCSFSKSESCEGASVESL